jgi:hypothetical protein
MRDNLFVYFETSVTDPSADVLLVFVVILHANMSIRVDEAMDLDSFAVDHSHRFNAIDFGLVQAVLGARTTSNYRRLLA